MSITGKSFCDEVCVSELYRVRNVHDMVTVTPAAGGTMEAQLNTTSTQTVFRLQFIKKTPRKCSQYKNTSSNGHFPGLRELNGYTLMGSEQIVQIKQDSTDLSDKRDKVMFAH